jgi:hypothetical protein
MITRMVARRDHFEGLPKRARQPDFQKLAQDHSCLI